MEKQRTSKNPVLSVLIASRDASETVEKCLREIFNQIDKNKIEIIVIDNSNDETTNIIFSKFPDVIIVKAEQNKLIPELWGTGITKSKGDIVALTTSNFVPAKNWIEEILSAHKSSSAGIGGAIENDVHAGIVSWAVYFCRYSRYMLPFMQENVIDFAADNASYKRADLDRIKDSMKDGFWEVFVHQAMIKTKMLLTISPKIVVYHRDSFTFKGFMQQRFSHGKKFGSTRATKISNAKRLILILLSPLIPFLYIYRITKEVFKKKRNIDKYLLSFPILCLFLISWSIGEFIGYLSKPR